jgi:hypothetical protein
VIELAVGEARTARAAEVGTEHLLIAVLREGEGIAGHVLLMAGVDLDSVRGRAAGNPPWRSYRARSSEPGEPAIEASSLVRVVPIGQSVTAHGASVELIALEIREAGAVLYVRARPSTPRRIGDPQAAVSDDAGTDYRVVYWSWDGTDRVATGRIELTPAPPPGASVLKIRVGSLKFTVPLGSA